VSRLERVHKCAFIALPRFAKTIHHGTPCVWSPHLLLRFRYRPTVYCYCTAFACPDYRAMPMQPVICIVHADAEYGQSIITHACTAHLKQTSALAAWLQTEPRRTARRLRGMHPRVTVVALECVADSQIRTRTDHRSHCVGGVLVLTADAAVSFVPMPSSVPNCFVS